MSRECNCRIKLCGARGAVKKSCFERHGCARVSVNSRQFISYEKVCPVYGCQAPRSQPIRIGDAGYGRLKRYRYLETCRSGNIDGRELNDEPLCSRHGELIDFGFDSPEEPRAHGSLKRLSCRAVNVSNDYRVAGGSVEHD